MRVCNFFKVRIEQCYFSGTTFTPKLMVMKKFVALAHIGFFVLQLQAQDIHHSGDLYNNTIPATKSIVLSGSSITWVDGSIQDGFSGKVVDYVQNNMATTVLCTNMKYSSGVSDFRNPSQYKGIGKRINGIHAKIEFELFGDEIAICQTKLRTSDHALIQVKADGEVIGQFSNLNNTIGHAEQNFIGDGNSVKFLLNHPATFAHEVKIDGDLKKGEIYTGEWTRSIPDNPGYLVIRKLDENQQPVHCIWFKNPPKRGVEISVKYNYGRIVAFEYSTVGQLSTDEENECPYGDGEVSFDPASPARISTGLEFRHIDKNAFWVHKFTEKKKRNFELEIIDGHNPYFIMNFAANRYHNFMNAGIGGWSLANLLDKDGINDYNGFFQEFMPDIIVNESATNDDWAFGERKVKRILTGLNENDVKELWALELDKVAYQKSTKDYTATVNTGLISAIDKFSLTCPQIIGSQVRAGDIIRIGTYHGDNKQVVCREIDSVNLTTGKVFWLTPLQPEGILNVQTFIDLVGAECSVRDLSAYQLEYEDFIKKIHKVSPHTILLITQPGLSNYRMRQLWGYDIVHRKLAAKYYNVNTIEVTDWLYDFQKGNISGKESIEIDANGSTGYILPWNGHWQGFEVWVDNKNVYGTDCYIDGGFGYSVNQDETGDKLYIGNAYDKSHSVNREMRLVFTNNTPRKGKIRITKADFVWSDDYCHTNDAGAYIYGQIYISRLKDFIYTTN